MSSFFQTHSTHAAAGVIYRHGIWPAAVEIWTNEERGDKKVSPSKLTPDDGEWSDEGLSAGGLSPLDLPRLARKNMKVTVEYEGPIAAPIVAGQELAQLRIRTGSGQDLVYPLQAGENIERLGPLGRITAALGHLVWGPGG